MKAIIVIDMVNDFVYETYTLSKKRYKGKLVVPLSKTIITPIEKLIKTAIENNYPVIYVEDEHTTSSEEIKNGAWPEHCIKETPGAETIDKLKKYKNNNLHIIKKDTHNAFTNLEFDKLIKLNEIKEVYLTGLVQEICIKENAQGFLERGYKTNIVVDATVPFDLEKGNKALKELEKKGARLIDLKTALEKLCK